MKVLKTGAEQSWTLENLARIKGTHDDLIWDCGVHFDEGHFHPLCKNHDLPPSIQHLMIKYWKQRC